MSNNGTATALMWIHALTPLHPGSGTALGVVDLPVQRERHTQWPTIPSSSLKGVLRDAYRRGGNGRGDEDKASVEVIFGPDVDHADKHAGAVSITDARLFAFPVRSLQGVFAWVTSPGVLQRLARDAELLTGYHPFQIPASVAALAEGQAVTAPGSPLIVSNNHVVLEEFDLELISDQKSSSLFGELSQLVSLDSVSAQGFEQRLVIVSDDLLTHFARFATEVTARIGLDAERKTVKRGALFYQEFLPSETILYSLILANASRNAVGKGPSQNGDSDKDTQAKRTLTAEEVLACLCDTCPRVLQFGGDETIGKGFCAVKLCK